MLSGVVLAAGASSRLGRPKQLLELDGRPLLQHVLDALAGAQLAEVIVVLGHEADSIRAAVVLPPGGRIVVNPAHRSGQASSLRAGLDAVQAASEAAVIAMGDQPGLSGALVDAVVQAWRRGAAPVARPFFGDVPGHPVVVAREVFGAMTEARGDEGARGLLDSGAVAVTRVDVAEERPLDVDTWEDYARLLRRAARDGPNG